jgi:hypothetical protein
MLRPQLLLSPKERRLQALRLNISLCRGHATKVNSFDGDIISIKMIQKLAESSGNVVGYKAIGEITASDYLKLEPEVRDLVEKEGNVRMLIDLTEFQWEKMEAWLQDLEFGYKFHNKITKMAIVGNKTWEKWLTALARPFYARDAKFFYTNDIDKAWAWLREEE